MAGRILWALIAAALLMPSAPAFAAEDEKTLKAIAAVIDIYLDGKPDQAEESAMEGIDTLNQTIKNPNDPLYLLMDYLSGNSSVEAQRIAIGTQKRPDAWAVSSIALFARKLARDKELDSEQMANHLRNYLAALSDGAQSATAAKWKGKADLWLKWCEGDFAPIDGLDPLLQRKSRSSKAALGETLDSITPEKLAESRGGFAARPKPAGLAFAKGAAEKYLDSLERDDAKGSERARIEYIKEIKDYFVRIFERNPYSGKLRLKSGTVNGTVAMANEHGLIIRKDGAKLGEKCEWGSLPYEQYVDFLIYYANMRLNVSGPNLTEKDKRRDAANDYLHAAALCDWYGNYGDALKHARQAVSLNPGLAAQANKLILGR